MKKPLVSIIVPCYNQAQFLGETLESVLSQDYNNWECIIVNDGSKDVTEKVANNWSTKDVRFKYFCKDNGGLSSARNYGIERAKGHFILPLDADDKISKSYISLAVRAFQANPELSLVYCRVEYFGDKAGEHKVGDYRFQDLLNYNMIVCSGIYKLSDWKRVGGYDENMKYGLEDWEFWINLLKKGGDVECLDYIGFNYRIKSKSMLVSMRDGEIEYSRFYILNKHKDAYLKNFNLLLKNNRALRRKINNKKFLLNSLLYNIFGWKCFKRLI